ncbi:thioredoxin superfamily protein [Wolffia australiana]
MQEERGIKSLVEENPVLILSRAGCCMCHAVKRLLQGLGVNPVVCELADARDAAALMAELAAPPPQLPAVFIGGRFVGGLDRLMAVHISGDLVPSLKAAGALWL